ncbi:uncharacterized protein LOC131844998 [Achroia grisella]|uniref:uncharacterized protein LOC131844998 n=1 Tax=Achroia grisella TaxID=688607 RepID=UPI0027D2554F|nr:uncharacterized protein LOC131844998 [Achroia grisella]
MVVVVNIRGKISMLLCLDEMRVSGRSLNKDRTNTEACAVTIQNTLLGYNVGNKPQELKDNLVFRACISKLIKKCIHDCPMTSEYNPVCGSNGKVYSNPGTLICARHCGVDVYKTGHAPCYIPIQNSYPEEDSYLNSVLCPDSVDNPPRSSNTPLLLRFLGLKSTL